MASWWDWFTAAPGKAPPPLGWGNDPAWDRAEAAAFSPTPDEFDKVRNSLPPEHPMYAPKAGRAVDYNFVEGKGDRLDIKPNAEGVAPYSGWELEYPKLARHARLDKPVEYPSLIERINPSLDYEKDLNTTVAPKSVEPFSLSPLMPGITAMQEQPQSREPYNLNPVVRGTVVDAEWEPMTGVRRNAPSQLTRAVQGLPEALKATNFLPMLGDVAQGGAQSIVRSVAAPYEAASGDIPMEEIPGRALELAFNATGIGGFTHFALGAGEAGGKALGMNALTRVAEEAARPAGRQRLVPSMYDPAGKRNILGDVTDTHGTLATKNYDVLGHPDDMGFTNMVTGERLGRSDAMDWLKINDPETYDAYGPYANSGRLEAKKYNAAFEKTQPLTGMPLTADVPGFGTLDVGPNSVARRAAANYMKNAGMKYDPPREYAPVDPERAARVADEFERMPHAPHDPEVAASYNALINETKAQFEAMPPDLKIEFIKPGMKDPYGASPRLVQKDIAENNHMWVYPTESGFGKAGFEATGNPMLQKSGVTVDGLELANNDLFRIVHDYFGHHKEGVGFRATGEDNAFRQHRSMFSPAAQRALTTETRGQNSWLNYGPHGKKNRTAKTEDTVFADQKVGLMPEWTTLYANSKKTAPALGLGGAVGNESNVVAFPTRGGGRGGGTPPKSDFDFNASANAQEAVSRRGLDLDSPDGQEMFRRVYEGSKKQNQIEADVALLQQALNSRDPFTQANLSEAWGSLSPKDQATLGKYLDQPPEPPSAPTPKKNNVVSLFANNEKTVPLGLVPALERAANEGGRPQIAGAMRPEVAEKLGVSPGPIKMASGDSRYGREHIEQRHGQQLGRYNSAADLVNDVSKNFSQVREAGNGKLMLSKPLGARGQAAVVVRPQGSEWRVVTGGIFNEKYMSRKSRLYANSKKTTPLGAVPGIANREKNIPGSRWYHGTTHDFDRFDLSKGDPEGYYGRGVYATNRQADATHNYASQDGPDLQVKIERLSEKIMADNPGTDNLDAALMAEKQLLGHAEGTVKKLKIKDKGVLHTDKDEIDFYEPSTMQKLANAVHGAAARYNNMPGSEFGDGLDADDLLREIYEQGDTRVRYIDNTMRNYLNEREITDGDSRYLSGEIVKDVYKRMGYTGVEMDAFQAFPGMVTPGTRHRTMFKRGTVRDAKKGTLLYANSKKTAPLGGFGMLDNDFPFDNPNAKSVGVSVDDPMRPATPGGMPLTPNPMPPGFTGSFDATANVPFTMGGRWPSEWTPEEFKRVGDEFGVNRLGPLSPEQEFPYKKGGSFSVPGGLDGKFTYYDMLSMKNNPIDASRIDPDLHAGLQQKMTRSLMPDEGDVSQSHVLSGLNFGMTSPGNPLFSNQLAMSRLRINSVEDLDRLANSVPWKFGEDPVQYARRDMPDFEERVLRRHNEQAAKRKKPEAKSFADLSSANVNKAVRDIYNIEVGKKYGLGAAEAGGGGGLGVRGNADYTRVAEMAQMFKKNPEWFRKRPDEQWSHFAERVFTQVPGMAAKTGSFGLVFQDPVKAAVSAIDRHMSKIFKDKFLNTPEKRRAFETRVLNLYNKKRIAKGEEPMQDISELSDSDLSYELLQELGKTKKANFRNPKGEIGKGVPEHMRDEEWIIEPKQAIAMGENYKRALQANADEASKAGLGLFESQWHLWDRIRRRLEPHENMFPGLEKLPRMSVEQLKKVDETHMQSGHKDNTKVKMDDGSVRLKPTSFMDNPADFAYFSNPSPLAPFGAIPAARRDEPQRGR
jgi:hypothetical protein